MSECLLRKNGGVISSASVNSRLSRIHSAEASNVTSPDLCKFVQNDATQPTAGSLDEDDPALT